MNLSPCGVDCASCPYSESCGGCYAIAGKPAFLKEIGVEVCPLYECPVTKKGYHSCAECAELPCELYQSWRDPSMSDEQHQEGITQRVNNLKG
jgi:hypothetical protein